MNMIILQNITLPLLINDCLATLTSIGVRRQIQYVFRLFTNENINFMSKIVR